MSVPTTYPGVHIEEISDMGRKIVGVATSITAFIGRALKGPTNEPVRVQSYAEYDRVFGGLWASSPMSYAVRHFFLNGGAEAIILRVHLDARKATLSLPAGAETLTLEAANEGSWGNNLRAKVDQRSPYADPNLFNLKIEELDPAVPRQVIRTETFPNISLAESHDRFITTVLEQESALVRASEAIPSMRPDTAVTTSDGNGSDGLDITDHEISHQNLKLGRKGLWSLEKTDLFNLLCIPPLSMGADIGPATLSAALRYCQKRRAILLVDPPSRWDNAVRAETGIEGLGIERSQNAALYFPRVKLPDPLQKNRLEEFVPSGLVAGVIARTDARWGVWRAPAGLEARLIGVSKLACKLTIDEIYRLNNLGINCLRTISRARHVIWGARTLKGADYLASEWKYLPVRRLASFIEESLYRGTQWAVFEPNDTSLWATIRLNVEDFMYDLFRRGAFQGQTPREAYFVKCDKETTTQDDINRGIVNILVGFAPLKPSEFIIIKISQSAGQVQT